MNLQDYQFKHWEESTPIPGSAQCSICLDVTHSNRDCRLGCGHVFHSRCICKWLIRKDECPLCRAVIKRCNHLVNSQLHVDKWEFLSGHDGSVLLECLQDATAENVYLQNQLETVQTELQIHLDNPVYLLPVYIRTEVVNLSNTPESE